VRLIAEKYQSGDGKRKKTLPVSCLSGERRFTRFSQAVPCPHAGDMETTDGQVIGSHNGLMYHTIGQRQGLGHWRP